MVAHLPNNPNQKLAWGLVYDHIDNEVDPIHETHWVSSLDMDMIVSTPDY